jgi:hypothetical protein
MTKATRKPQIGLGTAKRVAGGGILVDFIEDVIDNGAPQYAVTGLASIERISAGQIRMTKYSRRKDGNFVEFHEVWDYQMLRRSVDAYAQALATIERMWTGDGPEGRGREAH